MSLAAIHTLRGPRQVGKSTDLKLLARRALAEGFDPGRVLYLTLELLEGQSLPQVAETVRRARALARGDAPSLVLFDEVTFVERRQTAVKSPGAMARSTATSSSAPAPRRPRPVRRLDRRDEAGPRPDRTIPGVIRLHPYVRRIEV